MTYDVTCPACGTQETLAAVPRRKVCHRCRKRGPTRAGVKDWHDVGDGYLVKFVNGRWTKQHRLVMEAHLGRKLLPTEHVHHVNGNKSDNRIENLEVMSAGDHHREHSGILTRLRDGKLECGQCKRLKEFSEYSPRKGRRLGVQGTCRECQKVRREHAPS